MNFEQTVSSFGFRVVGPDWAPGDGNRFHIERSNGTRATILEGEHFRLEIENAGLAGLTPSRRSQLEAVAVMPKMSTFMIGAILNAAVASMPPDACYVNVGVWHGYSLLSAMAANPDRRIVGIDNFSQFGGPKEAFLERFLGSRTQHHRFHDEDYRDFFGKGPEMPIGVYFYDGEHSYENQLHGLEVAEPFFADDCLVFVDDTNWDAPRRGTVDFTRRSSRHYSLVIDKKTAGQHPTLWNGLMVLRSTADPPDPIDLAPATPWRGVPEGPDLGRQPLVSAIFVADQEQVVAPAEIAYPELETFVVSSDELEAAVEQSQGQLLALLPLGEPLPADAIDQAVARITTTEADNPFAFRNNRGRHHLLA